MSYDNVPPGYYADMENQEQQQRMSDQRYADEQKELFEKLQWLILRPQKWIEFVAEHGTELENQYFDLAFGALMFSGNFDEFSDNANRVKRNVIGCFCSFYNVDKEFLKLELGLDIKEL